MWQYNYPDIIQHYGVPGMKWGRRKSSGINSSKSSRSKVQKEVNRAHKAAIKKAKDQKKHPEKGMTDDELKKSLNRLNMEKQYRQLTKDLNPTTVDVGKRYTSNIMKTVGVTAATTTAAITLYNNLGTISKIMEPIVK